MLYPPMNVLLGKIGSRYLLVNAIARRSRQISNDAIERKEPLEKKAVSMAIQEIAEDIYSVKTVSELF
ncbi:MAG: DNA-directed RNA polymerase subunit omega [Oscillospiraceae bacterium]|nr:DNA-directed RNA polymerase subunit omega [Oscillospiraceae bacterium]